MKRLRSTPPFRASNGEILRDSVATVEYLRLGGLDQYVVIRGESLSNPLLIMLHGGPGMSETGFFRYYNAPLENSFTVVYWDQRGAGKSCARDIPDSSMTVEQLISDLDELVDIVRARFGKSKVVIFGHSWGSALGVLYAARFPDKVSAYVGSGQLGDWRASEAATYAYALGEAQRVGNRKLIEKLDAIGPPPYPAPSLWVQRMCLSRLEGAMSAKALWKLTRMLLASKESSILEVPRTYRGFRVSFARMWNEVSKLNLLELAPALKVPVFFFLGRKDHWVSPETSVAYFDMLSALSKQLVWFEASGHEPFVDEPAKFNAAMVELVRPVAAQDTARAA